MAEGLTLADANAAFDYNWRQAKLAYASKQYPAIRSAEQAMAIVEIGRALGLSAPQALMGIYIVEGKPQLAATTIAAFVRQGGIYDYRVLEHSTESCSIEFGRGEAPLRDEDGEWLPWPSALGVSTFTMDDARAAGLVKEKSGWAKYPRNMVFARAMSNGVKWFCPDVTHGVPVYHEGEIERVVDGQVISETDPAAEVSLAAAVADVPDDLRQRLYDAYGEAADLRSVALSPAVVQMSVKGQPRERVEEFIATVERANAEARAAAQDAAVEQAEVVEYPHDDDLTQEDRVTRLDVDDLNRQLADLYELRQEVEEQPGDEAETDAELDRIGREIERLEVLRDGAQEKLL